MRKSITFLFLLFVVLSGCKRQEPKTISVGEDRQAKKLLQGIWINEEDDDVAFRAKGDTIYYPDSTSQPVYFRIYGDTLELRGANSVKYQIVKQSAHLFQFKNQNGETVRLVKSDDPTDKIEFMGKRPVALNQNKLIKRDSIIMYNGERYHTYIQVNPTTYKVVKSAYNDEGVEVDNVYYDNIIHISVFQGARQLFSRDFRKKDFSGKIPSAYLRQSILSDILFDRIDASGLHFISEIAIPDSPSSYQVDILISFDGKMTKKVE